MSKNDGSIFVGCFTLIMAVASLFWLGFLVWVIYTLVTWLVTK